ncbi:MAG: hypothetical protein U1E76_27830 [Planctomycetota bacterium]
MPAWSILLPVRANSFEPAIALEPGTLNIALLTSSLNRFTAAGEGASSRVRSSRTRCSRQA